jgi:hypothetical protein
MLRIFFGAIPSQTLGSRKKHTRVLGSGLLASLCPARLRQGWSRAQASVQSFSRFASENIQVARYRRQTFSNKWVSTEGQTRN